MSKSLPLYICQDEKDGKVRLSHSIGKFRSARVNLSKEEEIFLKDTLCFSSEIITRILQEYAAKGFEVGKMARK